ncbi:hypothetical protein [Amycolatopsis samaneae]|uniref:Extracellular repeat, HAF family n=1 Tax=Amycolatopsis samaneae TaxID=664691 RepID=A0ABW5GW76_9PSEU
MGTGLAGSTLTMVLMVSPAQAGDTYQPADLGTLPGGQFSDAMMVTNHGEAFGAALDSAGHERAVRWDPAGRITDLPPLPRFSSVRPVMMSETGIAIGVSRPDVLSGTATRWGRDGKPVELPGTAEYPSTEAVAVSDRGVVAGFAYKPGSGEAIARRWDPRGGVTELGRGRVRAMNAGGAVIGWSADQPLYWDPAGKAIPVQVPPGGTRAALSAIDDRGTVVGWTEAADGNLHAAKWDDKGRITVLETGWKYSSASAITDGGEVIGEVGAGDGKTRVARWDARGKLTVLPTLGGARSRFTAANGAGTVLGLADSADRLDRPVYWDREGRIFELPPLVPGAFMDPRGISERGWIAGGSDIPGQGFHAVLWRR